MAEQKIVVKGHKFDQKQALGYNKLRPDRQESVHHTADARLQFERASMPFTLPQRNLQRNSIIPHALSATALQYWYHWSCTVTVTRARHAS